MGKQRFTKAEITRAVTAAKACDLIVNAVEICPDGTIKIFCPMDTPKLKAKDREPNEW